MLYDAFSTEAVDFMDTNESGNPYCNKTNELYIFILQSITISRLYPGEGKGYPTPVFWSGEVHGLYSPCGHRESDTTE